MNNRKTLLFIALGIVFWFNAAMIIRYFGATVFSTASTKYFLFFVLAIPLTILSIYITKRISGLAYNALLKPIVIMTFTATFLDGIALAWFRKLYSDSFEVALYGAAWIHWGVGLGLLFVYYLEQKKA